MFIIGVMEYWSTGVMGLKGLFEISKLLFQYSPEKTGIFDNTLTLQPKLL
jgi:hypothetical protein